MAGTRGLTLGKFAPFHRGHQLVIETALREVDELIVLIYDSPETTRIPLGVRAGWIRRLYSEAQVVEAWDGPTEVGDAPEIRSKHEDYVLNRLGLRDITHFYSSEFYGQHMSEALGAENRLVDPARCAVPVSGSAIRSNPFRHIEYIDPLVYRDLVTNVVFLGAPCTGKTCLAEKLADEFRTLWMPEYGREYWERHQVDRRLTPEQLVEIAEGHLAREEGLLRQANRFLFTDTNALTTRVFGQRYHNTVLPRLDELAGLAAMRYDLTFLCDVDVPYDDTWDRSGESERAVHQKQIIEDLVIRKIPFFVLRGGLEQRARVVRSVLARYEKYMNLGELLPRTADMEPCP